MTPLEQKEIRGITWKQAASYILVVVSFIISLAIRDINRATEMQTLNEKIQTLQAKVIAADAERATMRTENNNLDKRLIRIETILENDKK